VIVAWVTLSLADRSTISRQSRPRPSSRSLGRIGQTHGTHETAEELAEAIHDAALGKYPESG